MLLGGLVQGCDGFHLFKGGLVEVYLGFLVLKLVKSLNVGVVEEFDVQGLGLNSQGFEVVCQGQFIIEELGVNRNTINSDIKECYLQLADELPENEVASLLLSQLHTLRAQKARLVDGLEKLSDNKSKILYEKLICDIDWKIGQLLVKLMIAKYIAKTVYIKQSLTDEKNGKLPYGY